MADLIGRLRAFEGSDELGNGDFSLLTEAATEIEKLRAEVERSERYAEQSERERLWAEERAERLAEALRLAEEHINDITPEWYSAGQRVLAAIRDALHNHDQENKS